jgi:hypothetical protein
MKKSVGNKFHQYQQNEQSPLLTELTEHKNYHGI